jgi:hypothetical protein
MSKLPVPEKILDQHVIVLGKTGSGKSSKMRVLAEHLLDHDEAPIIIDPKGDWWGLKSSADGKHDGYPLVIFGGNHADVPLNPRAGGELAELLATGKRPSLIDLRGWMPGDRTRFFIDFAAAFFKHTRGKRWLIIDEVHNFAPKGKIMDPDAGRMLHWANRLASEGRGLGLNIVAASQRPQKVHNDFLTSCETLIAARVIHKADRDAIKDWVDGCADPAAGKLLLAELASMKRTDAWVWSPEIEFGPERVTFPLFKTYDSFKPQPAGAEKLKGWAEVDLDEVKSKLAAVVQEAQKNDPAALRKQIVELERQLKAKKASAPVDDQTVNDAAKRGFDDGLATMAREFETFHAGAIAGPLSVIIDALRKVLASPQPHARQGSFGARPENPVRRVETHRPAIAPKESRTGTALAVTRARQIDGRAPTHGAGVSLPKGEAALLRACIQFPEGLQREQFTVLTGYKRSSRDTYIQRLRERGLVAGSDLITATDAGVAALPNAEPLPTGEELQEYWRRELPEGERAILEVLIHYYPKAVDRAALDEHTAYKRSSRDTYLQRLRAKYLIEEPSRGEVRASERLF